MLPRYGRPNDGHKVTVTFSDIDGTLVHYPTSPAGEPYEDEHGSITQESVHPGFQLYTAKGGKRHKVLALPPNSAGLQGIISLNTLSTMTGFRSRTHMTVIVTGARNSTMLQRLPFLPVADAYVSENGGRIFWHDHTLPTAAPIAEDLEWRHHHTQATGPPDQEGVAPEKRQGPLWDAFRALKAQGWAVDARDYSTAFRVKPAPGKGLDELQAVLQETTQYLTCSWNLGMADVYPTTSGKAAAAQFLMRRLGAQPAHCRLLCDDANDLGLAAVVGHVYVVGITHPSVQEAADAAPEKFTVARAGSILATEEMLDAVKMELGTFVLG